MFAIADSVFVAVFATLAIASLAMPLLSARRRRAEIRVVVSRRRGRGA